MADPEVEYVQAYIPISDEVLTGAASFGEAMRRTLAGELLPPGPPPPTTPPAGHVALLAATDGPLRAVVELHSPTWSTWWHCDGCDFGGWAEDTPDWPCRTVELIAGQLGVELADG